ncbi:hypothetical protein HJV72_02145 [Extibacter sp. GGCC_0201]|nr:hypothetical protein [Extibacter sp. GGCC_0201]
MESKEGTCHCAILTKECIKYHPWRHVKRKRVKELSEHLQCIENKNMKAYTLYQIEQGGRETWTIK